MHVLSTNDLEEVSAGLTWAQIGVGLAMVGLGLSIAATGGLSGVAVGAIWGAGFAADFAVAGTGLALAGGGGLVIGNGISD